MYLKKGETLLFVIAFAVFFTFIPLLLLNAHLVYGAPANSTSCGDVNTNITLTTDINAASTCLTINASNIRFDCAGRLINYSTNNSRGNAINITGGFNNITIRNCRIFEGNISGVVSARHAIYFFNSSIVRFIITQLWFFRQVQMV